MPPRSLSLKWVFLVPGGGNLLLRIEGSLILVFVSGVLKVQSDIRGEGCYFQIVLIVSLFVSCS